MRNSLLSIAAATMLLAGAGVAAAQESPSAPDWNANQGHLLHQYTVTRHYTSYTDPAMTPSIGMVLPDTVTVYDMPDSMNGPQYRNYRYGMINDHPVVIENTTRKVVHVWD